MKCSRALKGLGFGKLFCRIAGGDRKPQIGVSRKVKLMKYADQQICGGVDV
jgi:hypothetical protein